MGNEGAISEFRVSVLREGIGDRPFAMIFVGRPHHS